MYVLDKKTFLRLELNINCFVMVRSASTIIPYWIKIKLNTYNLEVFYLAQQ